LQSSMYQQVIISFRNDKIISFVMLWEKFVCEIFSPMIGKNILP